MTETEWLRYLNPWEMLAFIARSAMPGLGRKLLLYAASVCPPLMGADSLQRWAKGRQGHRPVC